MGLFSLRAPGDSNSELIPPRSAGGFGGKKISPDQALRHSGVWACLRLRADLVSTMPVDLYRKTNGVRTEVTKPLFLEQPGALWLGGPRVTADEWLFASQMDLDRYGNTFGIITEYDSLARASRVDLVAAGDVTVVLKDGVVSYRIGTKTYSEKEIWHERQFVVPGLPVGLSPIAYAALTIGQYINAQEFALAWFGGTARPAGILKNIRKTLQPSQAASAKAKFRESTQSGDVLVLGSDWEFKVESVPEATGQFLEAQHASITDICRFLGVPGDMIDAAPMGSGITYANMTQRNQQLLIINMGPAIRRRERALTTTTPKPQFVKLNSGVLLELDPLNQAALIAARIEARTLATDESRALYDLPPLTPEQEASFGRLFGDPNKQPTQPAGGKPS